MNARPVLLSLALATVLLFAGCSGHYYRVPGPEVNPQQYQNLGPVSQTATGIHLFGIIPIMLTDKTERAVEHAIAQKGGDAITNLQVRERWYWAYVLNIYKIDISGDVLKKR